MDALTPVETYSWHTLRRIKNYSNTIYIGNIWVIDKEIFVIGATLGLLCHTTNRAELYLSISRNPDLKGIYYSALKRDYLFYAQRDQRWPPQGVNDLVKDVFLPAGTGFQLNPGDKLYFKCAAMNKSGRDILYDIFATIYYVKAMSSFYEPLKTYPPSEPINVEDEDELKKLQD